MFSNLFYDPRKLFLAGFIAAALLMVSGVMDYQYTAFHYVFLGALALTQLPLAWFGKLRVRVRVELPDWVAWGFLIVSVILVGFNINRVGLPYLLQKAVLGIALNADMGDYYHHRLRFTFVLWSLLTVLMPMALFVRGRVLCGLLILWPVSASVLIQIKAPFLFGAIYYLIFYQLMGRRVRIVHGLAGVVAMLVLFLIVNATRTSENLSAVARHMGLKEPWLNLSPLIWYPLSYVGGPVANGFQTISEDIVSFRVSDMPRTLPAAAQSFLGYEDRLFRKIDEPTGIPWPEANNAHSSISSFSHLFGLMGCLAVVAGLSLGLLWLANSELFGNGILLAIFVTATKNVALFQIGNYFIDPSFLGEFSLLMICLMFARTTVGQGERARFETVTPPGRSG